MITTEEIAEAKAVCELHVKWIESGKTLPVQYTAKHSPLPYWCDTNNPGFSVHYLWREKPSETSAEAVREEWLKLTPTDDPAVRVKDGKRYGVEWNCNSGDSLWVRHSGSFVHTHGSYRIVELPPIPAPKHRPYTFEDCPDIIKARRKSDGKLFRCEPMPDGVLCMSSDPNWLEVSYATLLADFEQLDGAVCGLPEESK